MAYSLLSELHRAVEDAAAQHLAAFTTAAFADLLRSCPGLAAKLFGDLGAIPQVPHVLISVPATSDTRLDLVLEGDDGFHVLIENRIAPETEWYEERSEVKIPSHTDKYIAAAKHRYCGAAKVLVLARAQPDFSARRYPTALFAGARTWSGLYAQLERFLPNDSGITDYRIRQFLHFLEEHHMNPSEPLSATDSDTILAFDSYARNTLKLLDDAVGRIRQEFDLKCTPNNRRMTGWYACSDRFESDEIHFFFYLMFPPVPDLVARAAVQVTKESSLRAFAAAAEHGFRRGRWGSVWVERDYRRNHPILGLPASRQIEELVRFFQTPLGRLAKAGFVKLAPARPGKSPESEAHPAAGSPFQGPAGAKQDPEPAGSGRTAPETAERAGTDGSEGPAPRAPSVPPEDASSEGRSLELDIEGGAATD